MGGLCDGFQNWAEGEGIINLGGMVGAIHGL